jgi:hypothetical protein
MSREDLTGSGFIQADRGDPHLDLNQRPAKDLHQAGRPVRSPC